MVEVCDITEEKLARRHFRGYQVYVGDFSIRVCPNVRDSNLLAHKSRVGLEEITVHDQRLLLPAKEFAKAYKKQFGKELEIIRKY